MLSKPLRSCSLAILVLSGIVEPGLAITVANPSFEANIVPSDGNPLTLSDGDDYIFPGAGQPGWTTSNSGYYTRKTGSYFAALIAPTPDPADNEPGGNEQAAIVNDGSFTQLVAENLAANTTYTLTVDIGRRSDVQFTAPDIRLGYGTNPADLLMPTSSLAPTPVNGQWAVWQDVFTTGANPTGLGQSLRIDLVSFDVQVSFDNVRLTAVSLESAAVPEPTTLTLTSLAGLSGMLIRRRRSRKAV